MRYASVVLLALVLLAAAPAKPPAHLIVPRALERQRSGDDLSLPPSLFDDPRLQAALGPLRVQPGAWAEYAVHTRGAGGLRARISILSALPDGRYWLEINAFSEEVPPASVKLLLKGTTLQRKEIERAFLWLSGQAPLELQVDKLPAQEAQQPSTAEPKVRTGAPETVQVLAGTFEKAETLRVADTRIWRAQAVPLWGLVKAVS